MEVACAAGSESHFPLHPKTAVAGTYDEVRDRAVGVAPLDRGLAAAVRLDALAHLPLAVLRPTRLEVAALRHVPVRRLSVEDAVGTDDAGQPDVDDPARRLDVEADPEPEEEDGTRREHPGRPHGAKREPASSQADPETAREQVQENRVDERDAEEDLAAVVEGQRDGQPEQHEEIEVRDRERASEFGEAEKEHGAERQPHDGLQQRLPAEGALPPACHLPGDLRSRPDLRHPARQVFQLDVRDLTRLHPTRP